jgi:putative SOS response-associated peptidase YedK
MPVILKKEDEENWLNPDTVEEERLLPFLKPYPDKLMTVYPISNRVNSPANNDSAVDKPVKTSLFD